MESWTICAIWGTRMNKQMKYTREWNGFHFHVWLPYMNKMNHYLVFLVGKKLQMNEISFIKNDKNIPFHGYGFGIRGVLVGSDHGLGHCSKHGSVYESGY